jgi:hypothetical protein
MNRAEPTDRAAGALPAGRRHAWLLALAGVLAAQAWCTLGLFGPDRPLARLLDEQPVVSGRHALHLYHGLLGARSMWECGSPSCYDPSFHAGYPKTPIFDDGSRPAELTLLLAGGDYNPAAYKLGLAALCLAVPFAVWVAARAAGLGRGAACVAAALAAAAWWSRPCREALAVGATDLLLAAVLLPLAAGALLRLHHAPGLPPLIALAVAAGLGCFAHPALCALFIPLFLVYYVTAGPRHPLAWHAALWGTLLAAVAANAFWLLDWVDYWWIRSAAAPAAAGGRPAPWDAAGWGGIGPRALAFLLLAAAAAGLAFYRSQRRRPETRLLGLGTAWLVALAFLGARHEALQPFGGARLVIPALLFAALPAAHAAAEVWARLRRRLAPAGAAVALAAATAGAGFATRGDADAPGPTPLQLGPSPAARAVVGALVAHTTAEARILWEDRHAPPAAPRWTPLLPLWTERSYIGGLDAEAGIEHTAAALVDGSLAGRPLTECTDADLDDYCRRYNVGWVVCWSERAVARFRAWARSRELAALPPCDGAGDEPGCLFALDRPHEFALYGRARWLTADAEHIVLADVVPRREDGRGTVVLSLHYHAGMRASPSRVRVERADDPHDPIPFVRLVVPDPVARVTLTWDRH